MQSIVYNEYLPVVLGEEAIKDGKLGTKILIKQIAIFDINISPQLPWWN